MRHPKHTAIGQWCEYGERRFYARSRAEARHAAVLEMQRKAGVIADWRHEAHTFQFPDRLRGAVRYTPDFLVTRADGVVEHHEVKGWWDRTSVERVRLTARHFPLAVIRIVGAPLAPKDVARIEAARGVGVRELEKMERREARKRRGA